MKNLKKYLISALMMTSVAHATDQVPRIQTNVSELEASPSLSSPWSTKKVVLQRGVYAIGEHDSYGTDKLLFVEPYVNISGGVLAILVNRGNLYRGKSTTGKILIGVPLENGTLKLSPTFINDDGNLAIASKLSTNADIMLVTDRDETHGVRFPYYLQGFNGALGGAGLGMRRIVDADYRMTKKPDGSLFSMGRGSRDIIIRGNAVTLNIAGREQQIQFMGAVNDSTGGISFLNSGTYNTMNDRIVVDSKIKQLAFFLEAGCFNGGSTGSNQYETPAASNSFWSRQFFVTVSPSNATGEFQFNFFEKENRSLWDLFFHGKR